MRVAHRSQRVGAAAGNPWLIRRITRADSTSEAQVALSETYSALTLRGPGTDRRVRMRLESVALPQVVISDLGLTTSFVYAGRGHHPWFALCLPSQGEVRVTSNSSKGVIAGGYGAILPPDDLVAASFGSDYGRVKIVMIDKSGLEDELAVMLGRGLDRPLRFDLQIDLATSAAAVKRSLSILTSELAEPDGLLATPQIAARLGRVLMVSLLVSCRHNYSEELAAPADIRRPAAIREALAAIEEDPAGVRTVSQIAKVSGLSVRALEEGFQRHVGVSPMRHLRRTRLARAHAALLAADADQTTATAVAHAWGFLNYGRFAAEYRKLYGRSPSETLKSGELGQFVDAASYPRP